jgi:hypothetical protein
VLKKYFINEFFKYKEELYLSGDVVKMNQSGDLDTFDWKCAGVFLVNWASRVQMEGLRSTIKYMAKRLDSKPIYEW